MSTWEDVKAQHKPVRRSVLVSLRGDIADEIARLEEQAKREMLVDKTENREPVAPQLALRIQELEREQAESETEFVFEGLSRRTLARIETEHPPTAEQKAKAEAEKQYVNVNMDTYRPAVLAASCVEPEGMTVQAWEEFADMLTLGQYDALYQACLSVSVGSGDAGPKSSIASAILRDSEKS